ncbi:MAG: tetratricopeptide repeat protein [Gammaproteobacteria bacterium]|nr:tetratricopeptide repeat protein [Gammaproteobacteria bacterium]MCF6230595.1 tetratricopeptide repeat protein [Gammaproteobacteria bacterium]
MSNTFSFEATEDNFEESVFQASHHQPVVVIFWANWCGPCKILKPALYAVAEEYQGRFLLATVETEQQRQLCKQFTLQSVPSVLLLKNSEEVGRFTGAQSKEFISAFIEEQLPHPLDNILEQAQQAYQSGHLHQAHPLIQQIANQSNLPSRIATAALTLTIDHGDYALAQTIISKQPPTLQKFKPFSAEVVRLSFHQQLDETQSIDVLIQQLNANPNDLDARHQLACQQALRGDFEKALQSLLEILKIEYSYREQLAHKNMLKIFDMLGNSGKLVSKYRIQMRKQRG